MDDSLPAPVKNGIDSVASPSSTTATSSAPVSWKRQLWLLAVLTAVLALCFLDPLYQLVGYAADNDFFSYIPLMPFITAYLIWLRHDEIAPGARPAWGGGAVLAALGAAIIGGYFYATHQGWHATEQNYLAVMAAGLVLFFVAIALVAAGSTAVKKMALPLALLIFMVPCPDKLLDRIMYFFQVTSANEARAMFTLAGAHVVQINPITLLLPDVKPDAKYPWPFGEQVDPECSGIHSTMVLLITALIAGYLFLRSPWRRALLAFLVIPLAIARNGFRIFFLGELCLHIRPEMIDTPIHHKGGPIFFALSLIPFLLLLIGLKKTERNPENAVKPMDTMKTTPA